MLLTLAIKFSFYIFVKLSDLANYLNEVRAVIGEFSSLFPSYGGIVGCVGTSLVDIPCNTATDFPLFPVS